MDLTAIGLTAGLLATALVFGSMAFFSAVVAPLIFTTLDQPTAGRLIRRIFPWYYLATGIGSLVAAASFAALRPLEAALMAAVGIAALGAWQVLMPAVNRARDADLAGDAAARARFQRLHRLSVGINAVQFLMVIAVLIRIG